MIINVLLTDWKNIKYDLLTILFYYTEKVEIANFENCSRSKYV